MWNLIARTLLHRPVTMAGPQALAATLDMKARQKLGRSLSIRQVDAGSCNGCELEIHALGNPYYDLAEALQRTYQATPDPKWVVAVGDCAFDGGLFKDGYAVTGGVGDCIPVDLHIRGCPPDPVALLQGLLALLDKLG